jgi:hypothetical protein
MNAWNDPPGGFHPASAPTTCRVRASTSLPVPCI